MYTMERAIEKCEAAGTGKIAILWDREGFDRKKNFDMSVLDLAKKMIGIL
jgi:hypothetical protein